MSNTNQFALLIACFAFFCVIFIEGNYIWSSGVCLAVIAIILSNIQALRISSNVLDCLKVSLMVILLGSIYYVFPLSSDHLRLDDPYATYDAQKYALSAKMTIETGSGLGHWLSVGIEQYIIMVYRLLGVNEVNILAINSLLLVSVLTIYRQIIGPFDNRELSLPVLLTLVPLTFFYTLQPSKEILSMVVVALFLWVSSRKFVDGPIKKLVLYVIILGIALLVRINLGVFLMIFAFVSQLQFDRYFVRRLIYTAFLVPLGVLAASYASLALFNLNSDFWLNEAGSLLDAAGRLEQTTTHDGVESGFSAKVKEILSPANVWLNLIFVPVKMLMVWVAPFPVIRGIFSLPANGQELTSYVYTLLVSSSAILNFILLPAVFIMLKRFNRLCDSSKYIFVFILVYLGMVAFGYPTQFTRHRSLVEIPMYMIFIRHATLWFPSYKKFVQSAGIVMFVGVFLVTLSLYLYI
jgi:hypothetical protein